VMDLNSPAGTAKMLRIFAVRLRPAAVTRALENLIGNAVRYGDVAQLSVFLGDRSLRYVVEDNGPGIPKDRREEALLPFARLDGARDPNRVNGLRKSWLMPDSIRVRCSI